MDIFPDGNLVRDIQKELDEIIQQGVFQITKLLQNSETATSSKQPDEDTFSMSQRKGYAFKGGRRKLDLFKIQISNNKILYFFIDKSAPLRGRLTERLLAQGLLTPNMLQELKKEWDKAEHKSRSSYSNNDDDVDDSPPKSFRRNRKK